MTTDDRCFVIDDEVVTERIGDEMILLDLKGERYLSVDAVGQQVWDLIDGGTSVNGIVEILQSRYQVDPSILRTDVDRFLAKLLDLGLVRSNAG